MHGFKDISVIIPTYNRADDLKRTLESFKNDIKHLNEVLIIDQSTNKDTENVVKSLKIRNIKYIHSSTPSLTKARNIGISKCSKKSKFICFLDDDVDLGANYFDEILTVFLQNPDAVAAGAKSLPENVKRSSIENFMRRIFCLENYNKNKMTVSSVFGNNYAFPLEKTINSEWIPGVNMCYKRKAIKGWKFDENFAGYALAEDFDFTYRLFKKHPKGLFISPFAQIKHRASSVERYPDKKIAYMNQINHFYLNFKNFNSTLKEKIVFLWVIFGISIMRILRFLIGMRRTDALKLKFFFSSLIYCMTNLKNIKNGEF